MAEHGPVDLSSDFSWEDFPILTAEPPPMGPDAFGAANDPRNTPTDAALDPVEPLPRLGLDLQDADAEPLEPLPRLSLDLDEDEDEDIEEATDWQDASTYQPAAATPAGATADAAGPEVSDEEEEQPPPLPPDMTLEEAERLLELLYEKNMYSLEIDYSALE